MAKMEITRVELEYVVHNNAKQRFSISEDSKFIRANQGHSVKINLGLQVQDPPTVLYHGTAIKNKDAILRTGIHKMNRNHVHLSRDIATATQVGSRHGKPIIFRLDTKQMVADGIVFYESDNGVWLTEMVDPKYLALLEVS